MSLSLLRRFRGAAIALVVLALSATAVFAAAPVFHFASGPAAGTQAEEPEANENEQGEDTDLDEDAQEDEDADKDESAEEAPEAPDAEDGTPKEGTHGQLVSTAAQMETPDGFANHGAFVSCVAKMKDVALADLDWTTVTPESCDAADAERPAARDAAKAQRQAEKDAKVHGKSAGKSKGAEMRALHAGGN